jgi:hypothetical protein
MLKENTMLKGEISFISPKGFFFISIKNPLGFITRYFGLRSRIVRNEELLTLGCTVNFEARNPQTPKPSSCQQEAWEIDVEPLPFLPTIEPSGIGISAPASGVRNDDQR